MDRDDQEMVHWYEKITRAAAENQLMVNFHGAFKTSGFDRTFPNQITREGVLGNEYNKWSSRVTPEHKVTLPFTRYLVGPGDFTPGGFLNRQPATFQSQKPTQVQGTRAAELALFVIYDSPLGCVCDHPDHYRDQPGADFLDVVPTVWDDTRVLDGAVGEYLVDGATVGRRLVLRCAHQQQAARGDGQARFSSARPLDRCVLERRGRRRRKRRASGHRGADGPIRRHARLHLAPAGGCVARLQKQ